MSVPLSVSDYLARMQHALGNAAPATGITMLDVLNEAMQYIYTYDQGSWIWRSRPAYLIDLVANQEWVSLPPDFGTGGTLDDVASIWSPTTFVHIVGLSDIARYRGLPVQNWLKFFVAVEFPTQASPTTMPPAARLAIWPTPNASKASAFRVTYRSGYVTLTDPNQIPNLPTEFQAALTMVARAKIMLYEFGATSPEAMAEMQMANTELDRLKTNTTQSDEGPITGGAATPFLGQSTPQLRPFSTFPTR